MGLQSLSKLMLHARKEFPWLTLITNLTSYKRTLFTRLYTGIPITNNAGDVTSLYFASHDIYDITRHANFHPATLPHASRKILPLQECARRDSRFYTVRPSRRMRIIYTKLRRYNAPRNTAFPTPAPFLSLRRKHVASKRGGNPSKYLAARLLSLSCFRPFYDARER